MACQNGQHNARPRTTNLNSSFQNLRMGSFNISNKVTRATCSNFTTVSSAWIEFQDAQWKLLYLMCYKNKIFCYHAILKISNTFFSQKLFYGSQIRAWEIVVFLRFIHFTFTLSNVSTYNYYSYVYSANISRPWMALQHPLPLNFSEEVIGYRKGGFSPKGKLSFAYELPGSNFGGGCQILTDMPRSMPRKPFVSILIR